MKDWARRLKREALVLWVAARHPGVPWLAKGVAALVAAYAFSPLDLIPDFIPVIGLVDDLLIVPVGVWVALKLVPKALRAQLRAEAALLAERPVSQTGLAIVIALWLALAYLGWRALG
ncbi:YkvA family protein [Sphingomicrobium astaxanthinifaciens]|uniref:YkvA family protein n=1 Tax=Sphingomicrobium astaxanthinifaciens TaxID=1227949 RepID=UPI001FCC50C5|nr:YkvA family protein [Sphingomicrobium astaxanthinifaciens]MCJ7420823.1 DUF1232 domain-containing protein [Sphingomicrobium astaxanthinifaciens]